MIGINDGVVLGEEYAPLGGTDFYEIAQKIKKTKPDVILNTVNGDSNIALFRELKNAGISLAETKVMSVSVDESMLKDMDWEGSYACWSYFESIDNRLNKELLNKIKSRYGTGLRVTDPMEAAYYGVRLWQQAVSECEDLDDTANIVNHLRRLSIATPEGIISILNNNHAMRMARIGLVNSRNDFDIVWSSDEPVEPEPYLIFRSKAYWMDLLDRIYRDYGGCWSAVSAPDEKADR